MSPRTHALRHAATAAVLAALVCAAASACESGAIGQNTPASNGDSFVSGDAGTTLYSLTSGPHAPGVSGTTLTGAKLSLSGDRGHVVVMNFWGSWCTPCRAEAPALAALADRYIPRGVRFLGIDIRDQQASAEAFLRDYRITYPSLADPGDEIALDFRDTVPPAGIPTTLVIDGSGLISARVIGEASYRGLAQLISRAVAHTS